MKKVCSKNGSSLSLDSKLYRSENGKDIYTIQSICFYNVFLLLCCNIVVLFDTQLFIRSTVKYR